MKFQTVTKQELPKFQVEQNPTYQFDSIKREMNRKLIAKPDFLVDKFLCCARIKTCYSQTLLSVGVDTVVLLSDFAQQLRGKNAYVIDIYFS